jgi:hypothetical protein
MATTIFWSDPDSLFFETHEITFDAVTSENLEDSLTVTENAVETGANTSDHARDEPHRFTIEGVVSSIVKVGAPGTVQIPQPEMMDVLTQVGSIPTQHTVPSPPLPLSVGGLIAAGIGALTARPITVNEPIYTKTRQPVLVNVTQSLLPTDRPREVYESLLEAKGKRALCAISSRFRDYTDMIITRVALPRTSEDGGSAKLQVDFQHIRFTETSLVDAPIPIEKRGAGKSNGGQQATKPAETPDPSEMESTLFSMGKGIGIFH